MRTLLAKIEKTVKLSATHDIKVKTIIFKTTLVWVYDAFNYRLDYFSKAACELV